MSIKQSLRELSTAGNALVTAPGNFASTVLKLWHNGLDRCAGILRRPSRWLELRKDLQLFRCRCQGHVRWVPGHLGLARPVAIWLDGAPAHTVTATQRKLKELFDHVCLQTPKSPDLSMLDAGVFPWMERQQQTSGASTTEEARGSALGGWRALQPSMLKNFADRVRRNATKVVELNGGNFYSE